MEFSWSFPAMSTWLPILFVALFVYYKFLTWNYGVFKNLGIKGPRPYPVVGTMLTMMREGLLKHDLDMKKNFGSIVGTFQGRTPVMLIYDTDILKQILIKDFSNFTNRYDIGIRGYPMSKMMTVLQDGHWKHVRNHLTPTFSSGKLRKMNGKMIKCAETLLSNLEKKAENKEIFEFREITGAYTMDVIASTAFGLQIDSHNDPNNQFVQMAKKVFNVSFFKLSTLVFFFFPFLIEPLSKLGFSFLPKDAINFFVAAVDQALAERRTTESENIDFLQLMINAEVDGEEVSKQANADKNDPMAETWTKSRGLSHEEILAQGIVFFLAGYDTTANTLALFGYEMAVNPDVQDRLIKEIDEVMNGHDHVTYDLVQKMPYMDMCLNEVMRRYPAGQRTDRVARNDIVINGLHIPKGMVVGVPIYGLQNDPELWKNPEKFDPDRFLPEAIESRDPLLHCPFGIGPRNCVGMRLALMELKMSMVHILQKLKFVVCEKTQIPLKLDKLKMQGVDGIRLRVEKR